MVKIPRGKKRNDRKEVHLGTMKNMVSLMTLEKILFPYITANTSTEHGYKTLYSDGTTTLNNTVAKGYNQMAPLHEKNNCSTRDPGMSLSCAPTRVCRKNVSRPGYVVKVRTDPGYVIKQCPRIVMNKIFDWH